MKLNATPLLRPLLVAAAFILPVLLQAQSPRMVLIEEATNASCGPCAAQNPFFERYLSLPHNREFIIPVIYRANFPGRDVMNAANAAMHNGRVGYYSISSVPMAVVNGQVPTPSGAGYAGAPSDTVALYNAASKFHGTISPITLRINEEYAGGKVTATVEVSSTEALSGKKLHIVVTEKHHNYANAGSNGEKDFYHIARLMLPDHNGTALNLAAGEKQTFSQQFTIDPAWNAEDIYIVAFVQDVATREVLQAGTDQSMPKIAIGTPTSIIQQPDEPGEWSATLSTNNGGEYTVEIAEKLPEGWTSGVRINEQSVTNGQKLTLDGGTEVPMNVSITPGSGKQGKGFVTVSVKGVRGGEWTQRFTCYASGLQALVLVKDEGDQKIAESYETGMEKGDVRYAVVERGDEGLFDLSQHVVVYEVGKWILERSDITMLRELFDRGGMRVYMIGAEIGYGLADATSDEFNRDGEFLSGYLHADYVADDNPSTTVRGIPGDPIGDGLTFSIANGVQNQDTPDELDPRDGATPIFYYGTQQDRVAGIRYEDGKTKLVFLGFGAEGIGNVSQRADVLKRGIAWLLGPMSVPGTPVVKGTALLAPGPNPASGVFEIPFRLESSSRVTVALYDLGGRRVAGLADGSYEAGEHTVRYDASALPSGTYIAVLEAGSVKSSRMITVAR